MKTTIARRIAAASATLVLVGLLGVAPASAGSQQGSPVADPASVQPGQDFTVSGSADCISDTTLTVTIAGLELSEQVSGAADWSVNFTVPDAATPDTYPITITGNECSYGPANVTVIAATTTTTAAPTTTAPPAEQAAVAASPSFTG